MKKFKGHRAIPSDAVALSKLEADFDAKELKNRQKKTC
jgi:hypothetical protein